MKNRAWIIFLIILLSVIAIALIGFMFCLMEGDIKLANFKVINQTHKEEIVNDIYENTFNKINIQTSASNIYIKTTTDDQVKLNIFADREYTTVKTNDRELSIVIDEKKSFFSFNTKVSKIELYLPEEFNGVMNIENQYGDIEVEEFVDSDIKIQQDCGDIIVKGGNIVTINNQYGDTYLEEVKAANIKESAGDVEVGTVQNLIVENKFGDIKVKHVTNSLKIDEDCGNVAIDKITLNENSSICNNYGDIEIHDTNEIYIEAKTDLGDVEVNHNYQRSDITLKLKNNCGDISVKN